VSRKVLEETANDMPTVIVGLTNLPLVTAVVNQLIAINPRIQQKVREFCKSDPREATTKQVTRS